MKERCFLFLQPKRAEYIQGAVDLVNKYNQQGLMLPTTYEKYQALADQQKLTVAISSDEEIIGTVAYTFEYPNNIWELGGLAVNGKWLHKGFATTLVKALLRVRPHAKTIASANKNSSPVFAKLGAKKVEYPEKLPHEVYGACSLCPVKPEQGCCNTFFSLAPVLFELIAHDRAYGHYASLVLANMKNEGGHFDGLHDAPEDW